MDKGPLIRIAHLRLVEHINIGILAERSDEGCQDKFDYRLKAIAMNTWDQVTDALCSEAVDGALIPAPLAMDLFHAGFDHKLVLAAGRGESLIVKNKASRIKKPSDFLGKSVLFSHGLTVQVMLFHRLMASVGLILGKPGDGKADVFMEFMPPYLMSEVLLWDKTGEIGGCVVEEPFGTQAIMTGAGEIFCLTSRLWPDHPCCVLVFRAPFLEQNRALVTDFVKDYAVQSSEENGESINLEISARNFLKQEEAVFQKVFDPGVFKGFESSLVPDLKSLETIQSYMADRLELMHKTVDLGRFIDPGWHWVHSESHL